MVEEDIICSHQYCMLPISYPPPFPSPGLDILLSGQIVLRKLREEKNTTAELMSGIHSENRQQKYFRSSNDHWKKFKILEDMILNGG